MTHQRKSTQAQPTASLARQHAFETLLRVERDQAYATRVFHANLKRNPLPQREISFAMELIFGTLRQAPYLDFLLQQLLSKSLKDTPLVLKIAMRLGAYELLYLNTPTYAVIHQAIELTQSKQKSLRGVVNGVLRNLVRLLEKNQLPQIEDNESNPLHCLALKYAHPTWVADLLGPHFTAQNFTTWLETNNQAPSIFLRSNPLKIQTDDLLTQLTKTGNNNIHLCPELPNCLQSTHSGHVTQWPGFSEGNFSVQNPSAQLVAWMADVQPSSHIL
ncbi:MAG TPA: hypothetical protein EYO58_11635, partial [Flavobacteriales bacterium]|nr:hypothetical protein [Flavobacteriales bacterium]